MSEHMRDAYQAAGELKYFFENFAPKIDLWRGLKKEVLKERSRELMAAGSMPNNREIALEPITKGFEIVTKNGNRWREPDVDVFMQNEQAWIKGCRTTRKGNRHWGISLWDQQPSFAKSNGWLNFCLPGKSSEQPIPIPPAIAITQDDAYSDRSNHYSIAPKDDMPLDLFVQHLKEIAEFLIDWDK